MQISLPWKLVGDVMPYKLTFSSYKEESRQLSAGTRRGRTPTEQGQVEGMFSQCPSAVLAHPQELAERWWEHPGGVTHIGLMGSREFHSAFSCECDVASTELQPRAGNP